MRKAKSSRHRINPSHDFLKTLGILEARLVIWGLAAESPTTNWESASSSDDKALGFGGGKHLTAL